MVKLNVVVAMDADKIGTAEADCRELTQAGRMMNGARALGIWWGVAIAAIFIPVFHFVLVPSLLVVGVVMFFIYFRRTEYLERADIVCPECQNKFEIKNLRFNWPLRQRCPKCQMVLLLSVK